ncbi:hypothetical protein [Devosia sp. SD17-2]|uniref:hypothetical protein n=1 Tax=Devosia sp. SD17-2 TaxID=2976459 RepID=UPI0023D89593|nr:hypothetical protein [Devosia sp. SD17-2]WEJ35106.1 hypothetical protein NYQ88_10090 [Devosia sp. SD17-2]
MEVKMRRILKAIAKALAAVAVLVAVWVESLGRFVLRCLPGYQLPDPVDIVEAYDEAAVDAKVEPSLDKKIAGIQAAADCLFRQQAPAPEMIEGLSPKTMTWLGALDADMLLAVAKAKPEDLREHFALRRQIRGLLRYEDDAIAEYRRAVEADQRVPKRPSPRRKQDPGFSLPAFGPVC